jgi:hypothetical protein
VITKTATANILEITTSNFTVQGLSAAVPGFLTLTSGTIKWSGNFALSTNMFTVAAYSLTSAAGLWLNNPNLVITGQNGSPTIAGLLRVTQGTYNIGTGTGNSLGFSTNAVVTVEGGAVNATGRFGVAASGNNLTYTQTGGTITVCTVGNASSTLASFDLGTGLGPDPIINGGSIIIQNVATGTTVRDYRNGQGVSGLGVAGITGGTLQYGNASTTPRGGEGLHLPRKLPERCHHQYHG